MTRRRLVLHRLAASGLAFAALVGCGGGDGPSPSGDGGKALEAAQAERLALVRFRNHETGTARFRAQVPSPAGALSIHGLVDWRRHLASAVLRTEGRSDPDANGLLQWSLRQVAFHPGGDIDGDPPTPPLDGRWTLRPIDAKSSDLDAFLLLILNLAYDRPDNPELLRTGPASARFLRRDRIGNSSVEVFSGPAQPTNPEPGPSRTRYWIDGDGRLRRFEARIADEQRFAVADLDATSSAQVVVLPDLGGPRS